MNSGTGITNIVYVEIVASFGGIKSEALQLAKIKYC